MSASSFDEALRRLLLDERGNDDDPLDRGGRTSRGITQRSWDKWRQAHPERNLPEDVWQAPDDEVCAIYKENYWDKMHCDQLPSGLDYVVFDYGVLSGIGRAPKVLQGLLGVLADGDIGTETLGALSRANPPSLINQLCDERLVYFADIVRRHPEQVRFLEGWKSRAARVRSVALQLWKQAVPPTPLPAPKAPNIFVTVLKWLFQGRGHATQPETPKAPEKPTSELPTGPVTPSAPKQPAWLEKAKGFIGFHEKGANLGIEDFIDAAHTGHLGDPWCAIFVNACLELCGVPGTRSPAARSFEHHKNFVKLEGPALGAVATFWRKSPGAGIGHVSFYCGTDTKGRHIGLGGNQSDCVCPAPMDMSRHVGWWWPASLPLPEGGVVRIVGLRPSPEPTSET
jgi:uncharacterized protein (TIGR02594 family)